MDVGFSDFFHRFFLTCMLHRDYVQVFHHGCHVTNLQIDQSMLNRSKNHKNITHNATMNKMKYRKSHENP